MYNMYKWKKFNYVEIDYCNNKIRWDKVKNKWGLNEYRFNTIVRKYIEVVGLNDDWIVK